MAGQHSLYLGWFVSQLKRALLFGSGDVFHILRHKKADTSAARSLQIKTWVDNRDVLQFSIKHKH